MNIYFLRKAFSEIADKNDFPYITLLVVACVVAIIILLLSVFRSSVDEFLRISDAELYVNKKGAKSSGTSSSKTQMMKSIDDPEKTTNMKTINLPRKTIKKGDK